MRNATRNPIPIHTTPTTVASAIPPAAAQRQANQDRLWSLATLARTPRRTAARSASSISGSASAVHSDRAAVIASANSRQDGHSARCAASFAVSALPKSPPASSAIHRS
jgi:hypothetical protein